MKISSKLIWMLLLPMMRLFYAKLYNRLKKALDSIYFFFNSLGFLEACVLEDPPSIKLKHY
jgi:hypothetical protein